MVKARKASMRGWGGPYQTESVPHRMRSSPTARRSLPSTWAASSGRRSTSDQVDPSSAHTLAPGRDAGVGEAGDEPADAALGIGVVGAFLVAGVDVVAGVVHDEVDVGVGDGRRADVPR